MLSFIVGIESLTSLLYFSLLLGQKKRIKPLNVASKLINSIFLLGFASTSLFNVVITDDREAQIWLVSYYLLICNLFLEYILSTILMLIKLIKSITMQIRREKYLISLRLVLFYKKPKTKKLAKKTIKTPKKLLR